MCNLAIKKPTRLDSLKLNISKDPIPNLNNNNSKVKALSLKLDNFKQEISLSSSLKNFPELENIFAGNGELKSGAKGNSVIAIQRGLMTLGYKEIKKIDAVFGTKNGTEKAIQHFQKDHNLEVNGIINKNTLIKLSQELDKKSAKPILFLPDMTPIRLKEKSWSSPAVKEAYGQFIKERWEYLKKNEVETDCKGLALKFMVDFRDYYKTETGITLPFPGSSNGVEEIIPQEFTSENPKGWSGIPLNESKRNDYDGFKKLMEAYPDESLIRGINIHFGGISADFAAENLIETIESRASDGKSIIQNHPSGMSMNEKKKTPEIDLNQLEAGDIIFIDHAGNGRSWDHTVNVIDVNKRDNGTVESVKLAVAAFDDMNDNDPKTLPAFPNVNYYSEEVIVKFNDKGKATSSNVTWSSEPNYVHDTRYAVSNTMMDITASGKLKVGRWSD